jgi:CHAT domain-containing protein
LADPDFDLRDPDNELSAEMLQALEQMKQEEQQVTFFERLPGTRTEAEAIVALLGGEKAWTGDRALKGEVLCLRSPRILHLATHGYLVGIAGMDSRLHAVLGEPRQARDPLLACGLALAGANWKAGRFCPPKEAGDGILTAFEVAGMDLRGTQLVVLSACETELGLLQRGDGLLGLRRSFLVAGARTLVSSLWKVPDQATAELMTEFYHHLLAGNSTAVALAQAQRALRRRYPAEPVAWGSFVCYGDPGQVISV